MPYIYLKDINLRLTLQSSRQSNSHFQGKGVDFETKIGAIFIKLTMLDIDNCCITMEQEFVLF